MKAILLIASLLISDFAFAGSVDHGLDCRVPGLEFNGMSIASLTYLNRSSNVRHGYAVARVQCGGIRQDNKLVGVKCAGYYFDRADHPVNVLIDLRTMKGKMTAYANTSSDQQMPLICKLAAARGDD